jgi:hypothetical protein
MIFENAKNARRGTPRSRELNHSFVPEIARIEIEKRKKRKNY